MLHDLKDCLGVKDRQGATRALDLDIEVASLLKRRERALHRHKKTGQSRAEQSAGQENPDQFPLVLARRHATAERPISDTW